MNKLFIELNDYLGSSEEFIQLFYDDPLIYSIYHQLRELDEEASIKYIVDVIIILVKAKQNSDKQLEDYVSKNTMKYVKF